MEKTWNKLKKTLTPKLYSSSSSRSTSSDPSSSSSRMRLSNCSSSRTSSSTSSSLSSKDKVCAVCLGNMRPGKGQALFTAECSHTFHFNCIVSNVKHGNCICPICRSAWKEMPFHPPGNGARVSPLNPVHDAILPPCMSNQSSPSSEPEHFSDDEPLLRNEISLDPTSSAFPTNQQLVRTRALPEFPAVLATESPSEFSVLVEVQAPTLTEDARELARAPIDLVVVLDVSGSMKGTKLTLLKRAVRFVIHNLGPADRLSIVSFSSRAQRIFPLRRMSELGHESATLAVESLISNGQTNIVEGLKKGARVLEERREKNPVASIILLSDGRDTYITGLDSGSQSPLDRTNSTFRWLSYFSNILPPSICPDSSGAEGEGRLQPIPVHTFGIGADHDATSMHALSDVSGGTFSFIQDANIIQDAFARCIGGLLSVLAQQLRVSLSSLSPGVKITSISSGKYSHEISTNGDSGTIDIGDLYADEEKDFLVQLLVPVLSTAEESGGLNSKTQLLNVECSYKDILSNEDVKVEDFKVHIRRPQSLSDEDKIVCLEVDRQRNRLFVVQGIAEAQLMAEKGNLEGAQTVLENRRLSLLSSASAQAGDGLCKWLEAELKEIKDRMRSQVVYEETGRAYTLSGMSSHSWQRTTTRGDNSNTQIGDGYETTSMTTMVMRSQTVILDIPRPKHTQPKSK
ncbi:hypothetical protein ACHQM5_004283 [Ranunculus cassubicifolius]